MEANGLPAHFEVAFGLPDASPDEPFQREPIEVGLGDGRRLRVCGRIDRVDRLADGGLRLRDYKTGRAPLRKDPFLFKGGRHLQMPFYVLAAASLFPGAPVSEAWLDYVDAGRRVEFDPAAVTGERFQALLRDLCDAIGSGLFLQEPESCSFCEFQPACGPSGAIAARRARQGRDRDVVRYALLREVP
jgi:RecB family exonuclease